MNFLQTKLKSSHINNNSALIAGSELLSKYQQDWNQLHANSSSSSAKAKELSSLLEKSAAEVKQTEEMFHKFYIQLQTIPEMLRYVDNVTLALEKVETAVIEVSCALDFYEKICHDHQLCNRRQAALQEVNELRISKRQELEKAKEQLAKNHSQHLSQVQSKQADIASKRQQELLEAIATKEA